jgi:hypothetical protein
MAPKIIPKGTRNLPLTRNQKIFRLIYFTPLVTLFLERLWIPLEYGNLSGYLDVESVAMTKTRKVPKHGESPLVLPLDKITRSTHTWKSACSSNTESVTNVVLLSEISTDRRIPKIIHQTAKSRCVTPAFTDITNQWKLPGYSYYFHDDEAISRLFRMEFPEFPHLKLILRHCVKNPTIKADLWRYLLLWLYGGIYADFDTAPAKFNFDTIKKDDDAFFVVEQYHILSQWFMAVSPGHPLMFYAVQSTLQNLLEAEDTLKIGAHVKSGPHALHAAFVAFRRDANVLVDPLGTGFKPVWSGKFMGTNNRTITVVGKGENENEYVKRMAVDAFTKTRDYRRMGMTHFSAFTAPNAKKSGQTCYDAMLSDVMSAVP